MGGVAAPRGGVDAAPVIVDMAGMLVIVAIAAEEFPVAAIGGVIIVVVVHVVDGEFVQVLLLEAASTAATDPGQ